MTAKAVLHALDKLGIQIMIRNKRLYCTAPRRKVPARLQKALTERKDQLLVLLRRAREKEDRKWIMTPDGPGKIWDFLPKDRLGVVLRADLLAKPDGEFPIRFYKVRHVRPFSSDDLIFCAPPGDPDGRRRAVEATWHFERVKISRIDDKSEDEWMVGTRMDKPGEYQFWALRPAIQSSEEKSMERNFIEGEQT